MATINVSFTDSAETAINAYFSSPQDKSAWPNQAEVETSDARWITYYDAVPEGMRNGLPVPG